MQHTHDRLRNLALVAIQGYPSEMTALRGFVDALRKDSTALSMLALPYLRDVAASLNTGQAKASEPQGQDDHASSGNPNVSQARQHPPQGQFVRASTDDPITSQAIQHPPQGQFVRASAGVPPTGQAGDHVPQGQDRGASPGNPYGQVRNPPRGAEAMARVQPTVAKSLFDTWRLPDGRSLREVRWGELPDLARKYRQAARVLNGLYNYVTVPDHSIAVDAAIREDTLATIIEEASLESAY